MTPQELVAALKAKVVDGQMAHRTRSLLDAYTIDNDRHTQWPRLSLLYQRSNEEEKRALEWALRQVMVDTLSSVLAILDGTSVLGQHREPFRLTYGDQPDELNGCLLDHFLAGET